MSMSVQMLNRIILCDFVLHSSRSNEEKKNQILAIKKSTTRPHKIHLIEMDLQMFAFYIAEGPKLIYLHEVDIFNKNCLCMCSTEPSFGSQFVPFSSSFISPFDVEYMVIGIKCVSGENGALCILTFLQFAIMLRKRNFCEKLLLLNETKWN